jgi:predicted nucleic acid-binding protein
LKALIDTSILVAALSQTHLDHYRALSVFKQIKGGQLDAIISAHTLAECYAVLTRLPVQPRISPQQAWQAISHDVLSIMLVFALTAADYRDVIEHLAQTTLPAASPTTRSSAGSQ